MADRYLHAVWCDDIRQEMGGKPSLMGVYVAGMTVPSLPFILHKLSIYIWAATPVENPFQKAHLKIYRDDGFLIAEVIPELNIQSDMDKNLPEDAKSVFMMFGLNIPGVEIPENCKYFTVTMETESEVLEGPKLRISTSAVVH